MAAEPLCRGLSETCARGLLELLCELSIQLGRFVVPNHRSDGMNEVGLLVTLQARPGKEAEVEGFLKSALPLVEGRPASRPWAKRKPIRATRHGRALAG